MNATKFLLVAMTMMMSTVTAYRNLCASTFDKDGACQIRVADTSLSVYPSLSEVTHGLVNGTTYVFTAQQQVLAYESGEQVAGVFAFVVKIQNASANMCDNYDVGLVSIRIVLVHYSRQTSKHSSLIAPITLL